MQPSAGSRAGPIIVAHPMGFYSKQGLNVEVVKTAGWAVVRPAVAQGRFLEAGTLERQGGNIEADIRGALGSTESRPNTL